MGTNKLFEAIEQERPYCPDNDYDIGYNNGLVMAQAIVLERDVVEVVQCKDCKLSLVSLAEQGKFCCSAFGLCFDKDFFCSNGERRLKNG